MIAFDMSGIPDGETPESLVKYSDYHGIFFYDSTKSEHAPVSLDGETVKFVDINDKDGKELFESYLKNKK